MKIVECSKATPWGIHTRLRGDQCPRCGWEAAKPESPAVALIPARCSHAAAA